MKTREKIKTAAIDLIIKNYNSEFTIEELANEAGIVRKTFYNNYKNKEELIEDIVKPIFDFAEDYLSEIENVDLLDFCFDMWINLKNKLIILDTLNLKDYKQLNFKHKNFINKFYIISKNYYNQIEPRFSDFNHKDLGYMVYKLFFKYILVLNNIVTSKNSPTDLTKPQKYDNQKLKQIFKASFHAMLKTLASNFQ